MSTRRRSSDSAELTGSSCRRPPAHHVPTRRPQASAPLLLFEQVSKWYGTVLALEPGDARTHRRDHRARRRERCRQVHAPADGQRPTQADARPRHRSAASTPGTGAPGGSSATAPTSTRSTKTSPAGGSCWVMARLCGYTRAEATRRTEAVLERVGMTRPRRPQAPRLLQGDAAAHQAGAGAPPRPGTAHPRRTALRASTRSAGRSCSNSSSRSRRRGSACSSPATNSKRWRS